MNSMKIFDFILLSNDPLEAFGENERRRGERAT